MTILFRVNLETVSRYSSSLPVAPTDNADNFRATRSTWLPNVNINNIKLKHGDEFTVTGQEALYLKNNYVTGTYACLTIVSET